ncbi:Rha family transcriptional regulator [Leuconostoc gelidum subsp. gelidum]|uniref:Rha family transcriptional regulator n=1 Tax=Leuconostoc gelidum TaxID=1244 RepID=UPI001CC4E5F1|nr:Rha family transcriptional regulator [Leuconostoc gelidum]MBZ6014701.1 Rha family transcriptional regulator [Leuconostoc gelidum subsp. gelidum]
MELVYYKGLQDEPYTTVNIVAEQTGMNFETVRNTFYRHKKELQRFGILHHERGSIQGSGQPTKMWKLNEAQATFLITLLGNNHKVIQFKSDLVMAFYQIKSELDERKIHRQVNKVMNIGFGDVIKEHYPDSKHVYGNFHNLAYKYALGLTPKQIKEQRHTDDSQSALTADESERLERTKQQIALFIQDGNDYQAIKTKLFADI